MNPGCQVINFKLGKMARDENDDVLPDQDAAKEFYAKYEPKEILGKYVVAFLELILTLYSAFWFHI